MLESRPRKELLDGDRSSCSRSLPFYQALSPQQQFSGMAGIRTHERSFSDTRVRMQFQILTERHSYLSELGSFAKETISKPGMVAHTCHPRKAKTGQ